MEKTKELSNNTLLQLTSFSGSFFINIILPHTNLAINDSVMSTTVKWTVNTTIGKMLKMYCCVRTSSVYPLSHICTRMLFLRTTYHYSFWGQLKVRLLKQ